MLDAPYNQEIMRFIPLARAAMGELDFNVLDLSKIEAELLHLKEKYNYSKSNIENTKFEIKKLESNLSNLDKDFKKELSAKIIDLAIHSEMSAKKLADFHIITNNAFAKEIKKTTEAHQRNILMEKKKEIEFIDKKIINELLDYALFLRASADRFRGEQETSPYFDDPKALSNYLKKAIA